MNLRYAFVMKAREGIAPFSELCKEHGISTKTGYKWVKRFEEHGAAGLFDQPRRPRSSPTELSEEVICRIVRLKAAHLSWGPRKIRELFARKHPGEIVPSDSSFKRVLEKAGLVTKRKRRSSRSCGRLQSRARAERPNDVWTVDFKGWWYTRDRKRCEPLTVRDAYSRYVLCASVPGDSRTETVRSEFERLFTEYGLPGTIRSDNGSPFAAVTAPFGLSRLSAWWVALGIDLDRIDPGRPDQNGAHERFHRDIANEVEGRVPGDLEEQAAVLEMWRQEFNDERPHEAISMKCPADLYERSASTYEGTPDRLEYPLGILARKVSSSGSIRIRGIVIRITTALKGWHVGLNPLTETSFSVHFGRLCVGQIDLETESFQTLGEEVV